MFHLFCYILFYFEDGTNTLKLSIMTNVRDRNLRQLSQRELKVLFEDICDSDFGNFRAFMRSVFFGELS